MGATPFFVWASSLAQSTGSTSVSLSGSGLENEDLIVLMVETANQAISTPSGFTRIGTMTGTGTAGAAGATAIDVYYKVSNGSDTSVAVSDSGDHQFACVGIFRGVSVAAPIHASSTGVAASATTAVSFPTLTTSVDGCLILSVIGSDADLGGARVGTYANANLTELTERFDNGSSQGFGGGIAFATGIKATAGATGATTAVLQQSATQAVMQIALQPDPSPRMSTGTPAAFGISGKPIRFLSPAKTAAFDTFVLYREASQSVNAQGTGDIAEILFNATGTKMYSVRSTTVVYQYSLSTAWQVNTASYDSVSLNLTTLTGGDEVTSISWSSDGTKFFFSTWTDYRYISVSTPFNLSTAVLTTIGTYNFLGSDLVMQVQWRPDGSAFYYLETNGDEVIEVNVSTPWTFTSASAGETRVSSGYFPVALTMSPDGKKFQILDSLSSAIIQYEMTTAWNVSTAVNTGYSYSIDGYITAGKSMQWSSDGSRLYISDTDTVKQLLNSLPVFAANAGSFVHTGQAATLKLNRNIPITTYAAAITGPDVILKRTIKMPADATSFALTGQAATLIFTPAGYTMPAASVSFSLTGQATGLKADRKLEAATTSYSTTLNDAILKHGHVVIASAGSLTLTGYDAILSNVRGITADAASVILTGTATGLRVARKMPATVRTYAWTRVAAGLRRGYTLSAQTASFVVSLKPAGTNFHLPAKTFDLDFKTPTFAGERAGPRIKAPVKVFDLNFRTPTLTKGVNINAPTLEFTVSYGAGLYKAEIIESCSGELIPLSHMQDSKKLEADAIIDLFEILLGGSNTRIFLKMNKTVEWQGNIYEGTGIKIEGVGTYADDQVSRPKLTIWNPEGIFSAPVDSGALDNAKVYRIRLLKAHLDDDIPVYRRQQWRVTRIAGLNNKYIALELRDMLDGQNFLTPGRMFIPPDFPSVSLT